MGSGYSKNLGGETSNTSVLNSNNVGEDLMAEATDVVVVGAGIHSLMYAIHTSKFDQKHGCDGNVSRTRITILEKEPEPSYKIGESTLTVFGLWLKTVGIDSALLWRLFGPKDGLAFYYFSAEGDPESYTHFVANGPPGDFVPTLQIERKISELLLTLYAQRLGVDVLYGHEVKVDDFTGNTTVSSTLRVHNTITREDKSIDASLVIDASGRFHRFASKESRIERFDTFNTHAFWAYFTETGDESDIPLKNYESCNTNHICIAEGWAWVIRLPTWEGSPLPSLIKMINYLLDLNQAKTPADQYPSTNDLIKMFNLKFRWVVSIGFALRSDVVYPSDLHIYGSCEAERKFNWIVKRYAKITQLMNQHTILQDLYGPGTTWYIRKNLTYNCPQVTGTGWAAIGDATGFTNPLYSPGINANMATSIYAAEMTHEYLHANALDKHQLMQKYERFCKGRIENLNRMNVFNYVLMRSPQLGPIGPIWQYLCGTGNVDFQQAKVLDFTSAPRLLTTWNWGADQKEYIDFANHTIDLLHGSVTIPSQVLINQVRSLSEKSLREVIASGKFKGRWGGLLRWYDDNLNFDSEKYDRDILAKRCKGCGEWRLLCGSTVRKCPFCAFEHTAEESTKILFN